jgi:hypothetical protein
MAEAAAAFGTDRLVAKPRVSHSAWQTIRWSPGEGLEDGPEGAAIIQPYLPEIETKGELSLIYFGGEFSHAVGKVPQPGDFRVQPEYDGIIGACEPEPTRSRRPERILAAVEEDLLYARIDLARGPRRPPRLDRARADRAGSVSRLRPGRGRRFAAAVMREIGRPSAGDDRAVWLRPRNSYKIAAVA